MISKAQMTWTNTELSNLNQWNNIIKSTAIINGIELRNSRSNFPSASIEGIHYACLSLKIGRSFPYWPYLSNSTSTTSANTGYRQLAMKQWNYTLQAIKLECTTYKLWSAKMNFLLLKRFRFLRQTTLTLIRRGILFFLTICWTMTRQSLRIKFRRRLSL